MPKKTTPSEPDHFTHAGRPPRLLAGPSGQPFHPARRVIYHTNDRPVVQGDSGTPRQAFLRVPRGIVSIAKVQPDKHFEAVLGRNSPEIILLRLFGTCVALRKSHSAFRTGRAGRLPRVG